MVGKRYKPEKIVLKLRQVEVLKWQGSRIADVRQIVRHLPAIIRCMQNPLADIF